MSLRLINALSSPYGRKVAVALKEKAIPFDVTFDVPWGDDTCVAKHSPLEQLPILILDDKTTVFDSSFILEWLEVRYPNPPLLPSDPEQALATRFLKLLGERVMEAIHAIVFELQRAEPSQPFVDRQSRKVRRGLAEIEATIERRHPVAGIEIDIGDIAVGTMLLLVPFLIRKSHRRRSWRDASPRTSPKMAVSRYHRRVAKRDFVLARDFRIGLLTRDSYGASPEPVAIVRRQHLWPRFEVVN